MGGETPLVTTLYRRAIREHDEIECEVQKLLKAGLIRPPKSPWSVEVVMVKPNRLCFNFKPLNAITIKDRFPIPRIDEITESLRDSVIFSSLDATKCYNQFNIDEDSRKKAAFSTKSGHYEPNRILFGLANAPSFLARALRKIFKNYSFIKYYFDDILVHSKNIYEHIIHLSIVFNILRVVNLKINPDKCKFFQTVINILGVTLSNNTIMMDKNKVQAILDWKAPTNVKGIESFLGFKGYNRKFIKDYAMNHSTIGKIKNKRDKI